MSFPPGLYFECCPRPIILLSKGEAIDLTMGMYPARYQEEVWPENWDDWEKSQWSCPRCHMPVRGVFI